MLRSAFKFSNCLNVASKNNFQPIRNFRRARVGVKKEAETFSWKSAGIRNNVGSMEVGQMAVSGSAVIGLGALCYYGLGLASRPGAIDNAVMWPDYVRSRISSTYLHLGGSLATVTTAAIAFYRSPYVHKFVHWLERRPVLSLASLMAAVVGSGAVMRSIPYESPLTTKYAAWLTHGAIMGVIAAPVGFIGGSIAIRAAWYTLGLVGGLSAIAVCAPSEKFLTWAGPLGIGIGGLIAASFGSVILPPTSALALPLHSLTLYGGLILFSCFLLYDTQMVIRKAEHHQEGHVWNGYEWTLAPKFDPINASSELVLDVMNLFLRIVYILAMGGGRKK